MSHAPLFIVGCPRAGLSLLMEVLAAHEDFGWVSMHAERAGRFWKAAASLNRLYDLPGVGKDLYRARLDAPPFGTVAKILPYPTEPWAFWQSRIARFTPMQDGLWLPESPGESDILPAERDRVRDDVRALLEAQRRKRLLSFYAGHARMRLLSVPFPDAIFVHVIRDARAVAESFHRMVASGTFRTWEERHLWPRVWPERWRRDFADRHHNPFGLCVYLWMHFTTAIRAEGRGLGPNHYVEIRYENLVRDPAGALESLFAFASLPASARIARLLKNFRLRSAIDKWKTLLTPAQLGAIDSIIEPELRPLLDGHGL
jgi:hypothetical protein